VALTSENKDSFLFKIAYCSEKYYVLCESEETGKLIEIIGMKDQTIISLYCFCIKHPALHGRSDCLMRSQDNELY
jgi:hypothetical protein